MNPRGCVPVLDDQGTIIRDSLSILRYIEILYPDPQLIPSSRKARAKCLMYLQEAHRLAEVSRNLLQHCFGVHVLDESHLRTEITKCRRELAVWDNNLARSPGDFLLNVDAPQMCDFAAFPHICYLQDFGLDFTPHPKYVLYSRRIH